MHIKLLIASVILAFLHSYSAFAADNMTTLTKLNKLKQDYMQRIQLLEKRLNTAEASIKTNNQIQIGNKKPKILNSYQAKNSFNPNISLILDGQYTSSSNESDEYELPGFILGGESGLKEEGFSLGHTEITISSNVDDKFYGAATVAIDEHDGETELKLEEAFIQTIGLGNGITVKAGRFFSAIGYLNETHEHTWDFADAPLIYRGLFGNQLRDDGLQINYIAPTDTFLQVGAEVLKGGHFSVGGKQNNIGAWTVFTNIGGDIGIEHSWLLGLNHWQADDIIERTSSGHSHGGESHGGEATTETPSFTGKSKINALDLVYKWAPNGNPKNKNFKFQFEYFDRSEDGEITLLNSDPLENTSYDGNQKGWYAQAIYQFMPQWKTGLRYDQLDSKNTGSDNDALEEAGLDNENHKPKRYSAMLEWLPSEFSRIRLQFNHDKSYENTDNQVFLQYTHSLGSHGAHQF